MGKKQKYKLPEHEQQHNRVDIFRNIQSPLDQPSDFVEPGLIFTNFNNRNSYIVNKSNMSDNNSNEISRNFMNIKRNSTNYLNSYTNETFISSSNDLNKSNITNKSNSNHSDIINTAIASENNNNNNKKNAPKRANKNKKEYNIWATTSSFAPNFSYFSDDVASSAKDRNVPEVGQTKKSNKKKIIIVTVCMVSFLCLVAAGVVLAIYLSQDKEFKNCNPTCTGNRYCLIDSYKNASCECKPGFIEDALNKNCKQFLCYNNYSPYTYLNNNDMSQIGTSTSTESLKAYCCPNSNFLTPSCCGIAAINKNLNVSKRIIGGDKISLGVFPWIVYIVQMYRSNPNQPLTMIKNCTGALISDRFVLTASHCIDLEPNINLNNEFNSIESIVRVYFGFVDKAQIFEPKINISYERRSYKITKHPNYNIATLENDLAVIQLDRPIQRSETVDYLCLFNYGLDDEIVKNSKLYVAGWGSTNANINDLLYPNSLNYVDAVINPMTNCRYIIPDPAYNYLFNPKTLICAGYNSAIGKDTCYADSGAPLMVQLNDQWFAYGG